MILPVTKLASGFAAVASVVTSKCRSNECFQAAVGGLAGSPPVLGASTGIVPVLATATATEAFSSTTPMLLQTIRGGTSASAIVNVSRESLFLQGLATYGTITALIMNAALRMWTSTNFKKDQNKIVSNVFNAATALCLMSGVFTAILFQLLTIYSKSGLGMGNDAGYIAFKTATQPFRVWGFRCFLTEMISFVVCFVARLYNTMWDVSKQRGNESALTTTGKYIMGGSVVLMIMGAFIIRSVLKLASQHIF